MLRSVITACWMMMLAAGLLLFSAAGKAALAADAQKQQVIKQVETYLNDMNSMVADFVQIAPDGSLSSGKFFMQRPGKLRWQYEPPTPILMVSNGKSLAYYDYELEQLTWLDVEDTLANFIAQDKIRLTGPVTVESVEQQPGSLRVTLYQTKKKNLGTLTLAFADPMELRNMEITDKHGKTTTVTFTNLRTNSPLDNSLFVFKDPRSSTRRIK
jgi:chaperone LolA